jgi:glycosyltransferase involved in cell wall biosynthesis
MISFFVNLILISSKCSDKYGRPDIILASSVHPLTLVAGIIISRKFKIPCICEVRDLWPESLVAYKIINKDSLLTSILYKFEKWIYRKADSIIMTWEGGKDYIQDQGWEKEIQLDKIAHISNGVDLESFDRNSVEHQILDEDLDNATLKNIIYTGSVRKVNNLGIILDVAKIIQNKGLHDIRFLIYGAGDEKEVLVKRCVEENIQNVIFKGRINKNQVPAVLKKAYANLLHNTSTSLDKYGQSQNKLFEYLAAGKCIIQTYMTNYNLCERYNCGYVVQKQEAELIADAIISAYHNPDQCEEYGRNAREAASNHDFTILTDKLIKIIEGHLSKKESIGV